jgi:hypothetical protein
MHDFFKELSPKAAQVADRVGHATYQDAIRRYVSSTRSAWLDADEFLTELERQTGVAVLDVARDERPAGEPAVPGRARTGAS